jgi:hypothetical protein
MIDGTFWPSFWPNLASTLVGLVLGIPLALWVNQKINEQAERARGSQESVRLAQALSVVVESIADNSRDLKGVLEILIQDRVPLYMSPDVSTWDVVKPEIVPFAHDPVLVSRVAAYFAHVSDVPKLHAEYLYYAAGMGATLSGSPELRNEYKSTLVSVITAVIKEADELLPQIRQLITSRRAA